MNLPKDRKPHARHGRFTLAMWHGWMAERNAAPDEQTLQLRAGISATRKALEPRSVHPALRNPTVFVPPPIYTPAAKFRS